MIIYSEERCVPTDINMMVIRGEKNHGYFYVHRLLYDQAVILYDSYSDDIDYMVSNIIGTTDMRDDVAFFLDNVPVPLNIFGPFLLLVKEPLTKLEDMVGAIHVMSMMINFRAMFLVPEEIRNRAPKFSLSIKEEYELAWDRFFQNAIPYSIGMFQQNSGVQPMNGVQTSTVTDDMSALVRAANASSYLGEEGLSEPEPEVDINDPEALTAAVNAVSENMEYDAENVDVDGIADGMMDPAALEMLMNMQWDFGDDTPAEEETPEPKPEPEPEPEPAPAEQPKGVDAILAMV